MSDTVTPEEMAKRMRGTRWVLRDPKPHEFGNTPVVVKRVEPPQGEWDGAVHVSLPHGGKMSANLRWFMSRYRLDATTPALELEASDGR